MRVTLLLALLGFGCHPTTTYTGVGDVVEVEQSGEHVTIRHDDIPGLMGAMTMRFAVRSPAVVKDVMPGARVRFELEQNRDVLLLTRVVSLGSMEEGRAGVHDHTPRHGGVVAMWGMVHVEAVASRDGRVRLYLSDQWRRPLPPAGATGSVMVDAAGASRSLSLTPRDDALEAVGPPLAAKEVLAHVRLTYADQPIELHFVLPLGDDGASGGVSVRATTCVPVAGYPGAHGRQPRCTFAFGQSVSAVATTPDGATAIVAVAGGWPSAWRLPRGDFIAAFGAVPSPATSPGGEQPPHDQMVDVIAVAPGGGDAVVAAGQRLLRYHIETGRLVAEVAAPGGVIRDVAWSPDGGRLLVSDFPDAAARLLDAASGAELRRLPVWRQSGPVAVTPDGALAAVASDAGPIALFDLGTAAVPYLLTGSPRPAKVVVFAGGRLVSAGEDGTVRFWDVAGRRLVHEEQIGRPITRLAAAPEAGRAASAGVDGIVRLYDVESGAVTETLEWHRRPVTALAWAGPLLLSGDVGGDVALWDLAAQPSP